MFQKLGRLLLANDIDRCNWRGLGPVLGKTTAVARELKVRGTEYGVHYVLRANRRSEGIQRLFCACNSVPHMGTCWYLRIWIHSHSNPPVSSGPCTKCELFLALA